MIKNKNKFTYNMRNEKGITLMALVVTIIVMLILSTITITTLIKPDNLVSSVENEKSKVLQLNAKQEVDVAIEKLKLANGNIKLTVSDFSKQLEEKLRNNDKNAIVTPEGEGYKVIYNGYTFNYYYDYIEVTFDANGGNVKQNSKLVTYDQPYGELPTPTRNGYNFAGWYTEKNGGTKVESTTKVTLKTNHTLYANWIPNKYTISYDANGGTGVPTSQTENYGEDLTLRTEIPTKQGYTFLGWSEDKNATTETYAPGETITLTKDMTLYAVWNNTITFSNGTKISGSWGGGPSAFGGGSGGVNTTAVIPSGFTIYYDIYVYASQTNNSYYGAGYANIEFKPNRSLASYQIKRFDVKSPDPSISYSGSYTTTEDGTLDISIGGGGGLGAGANASATVTKIVDASGFEYILK